MTQTLRRAPDRDPRGGRGASTKAYFSSRALPAGAARDAGGTAAAMWLTRRARDPVLLRRLDQRGVHGAPAQARPPRRAALLVLRARDGAARRLGGRVPGPLRQRRAPFRRARAAPDARGHRPQRGLDAGAVRRRRGRAVAARPLGSPAPEPLRPARGRRSPSSRPTIDRRRAVARDGARRHGRGPRPDDVRDRRDGRARRSPTRRSRPDTASARTSRT